MPLRLDWVGKIKAGSLMYYINRDDFDKSNNFTCKRLC